MHLTTTSLVATRMARWVSEPINADEGCAELQLKSDAHKVLRQHGPVEFAHQWGTHYISGYKKAVFYAVVINTKFTSSEKRNSASTHVGVDVSHIDCYINMLEYVLCCRKDVRILMQHSQCTMLYRLV